MGNRNYILFLVGLSLCFLACKKDDLPSDVPTEEPAASNKWVLDSMNYYYYWNNAIPPSPDFSKQTAVFFESLLSVNDRFSWISNAQTASIQPSTFEKFGFHYIIIDYPSAPAKVVGVITLVAPNSPAAGQHLKRGDYFTSVNNTGLAANNLETVIAALGTDNISLTFSAIENGVWKDTGIKNLFTGYFSEHPVYMSKCFRKNNIVTGYLYYNAFNETYDEELINAIRKLKAEGATELILDLRYNTGGAVATSAKLAALLIKPVPAGQTYIVYQGNSKLGKLQYSFDKTIRTSGNPAGIDFGELNANSLKLDRIFILSSAITASAAELVINNLKPFMLVVHIGEVTLGKDEGSITIKDGRIPPVIPWTIKPIVFKLFNAGNQGDYGTGISPTFAVNEYERLPLAPVGDSQDPLIAKSLQQIYTDVSGLDEEAMRKSNTGFIELPIDKILVSPVKTVGKTVHAPEVIL